MSADTELRALVAREKSALVDPPDEIRRRLAERLAVSLSGPAAPDASSPTNAPTPPTPPTPAPTPPTPSLAAPRALRHLLGAAGLFAGGLVVGVAAHARFAPPTERIVIQYVDRIVEPPAPPLSAPTPAPAPTPPAPAPSPRAAPPIPAPTAPASDEDLARERELVDRARSALARSDAPAALAAVAAHETSFPRGQLVEMREALAVQALVQAGRAPEARSRASRFHARFPGSLYGSVVDAALASIP